MMKLIKRREDLIEIEPLEDRRLGLNQILGVYDDGDSFRVDTGLSSRELLEFLNDFSQYLYREING